MRLLQKGTALQIVNGYVCQTCCDVTAAKAGKDPAHPNTPPGSDNKTGQAGKTDRAVGDGQTSNASSVSASNASQPGFAPNAVSFGGALGQANANSPVLANVVSAYKQGAQVNVTA